MVKINVQRFTINEKKINNIINIIKTPEVKNLITSEGNILLKNIKNSIPENMDRTKISKKKTLKNSLQIGTAKYSKAKLKGYSDVEKIQINIGAKPFQKYFAVVLSGKNSYNTASGRIKKDIEYTKSNAESFIFQDEQRKSEIVIYKEFYRIIYREMEKW